MDNEGKEGIDAKCKRCNYEWTYTGKAHLKEGNFPVHVGCPNCKTSVKIRDKIKVIENG